MFKKIILLLIIFGFNSLFGQNYGNKPSSSGSSLEFLYADIRLGAFFPDNMPVGARFGILAGIPIDEIVSLGFSIDYFRSQDEVPNVHLKTYNLGIFMLNARIDSPIFISPYFQPFLQFGLGYELLTDNFKDTNTNYNTLYGDFAIDVQLGFKVELGEKTDMFISCDYNICVANKLNLEVYDPTAKKLLNGLSALGGISFRF